MRKGSSISMATSHRDGELRDCFQLVVLRDGGEAGKMVGDGDRVEVRMTRALDLDPFRPRMGGTSIRLQGGQQPESTSRGSIHRVSRIKLQRVEDECS